MYCPLIKYVLGRGQPESIYLLLPFQYCNRGKSVYLHCSKVESFAILVPWYRLRIVRQGQQTVVYIARDGDKEVLKGATRYLYIADTEVMAFRTPVLLGELLAGGRSAPYSKFRFGAAVSASRSLLGASVRLRSYRIPTRIHAETYSAQLKVLLHQPRPLRPRRTDPLALRTFAAQRPLQLPRQRILHPMKHPSHLSNPEWRLSKPFCLRHQARSM
jgi:hypothetical protein